MDWSVPNINKMNEAARKGIPMRFIDRQTENLKRLIEAHEQDKKTPEELRGAIEHQKIVVELQATRCPRCGSHVFTLYPVPSLCGECWTELKGRDATDNPGLIGWWPDLLNAVSKKK